MKIILFFCSFCIYFSINQKSELNNDLVKYKNACTYIINDNASEIKDVFISGSINDMDRDLFKNIVDEEEYKMIIDSFFLIKYTWFESFPSKELEELFGKQPKNSDNILFFSSIEKNTLRADLFIKRFSKDYFSFKWMTGEKVYAYLFFFDDNGNVKKAFKREVYWDY